MQPFMVHYTASKHAVTGMARAFAAELGKHSIRVNSVHPGPVNTAMGSGDMVAAVARATETNPQLANMLTPFLPNWVAEPEDIADAVCWLASDESRYVTAAAMLGRSGLDAVLITRRARVCHRRRRGMHAPSVLADQIQRAQVADRPAAAGQHGQHHVVTAVGGGGERESQRRDQQGLRHAEPVIAPTGFAVIAGDAVAG